jgi:dethiobiotin synthetase
MSIFNTISITVGIVFALTLSGCDNIGNAPKGPDASEVQQEVSKETPQQQINFYKFSPMSADKKAAKIKEIEEKYGVKDQSPTTTPPKR